MAVTHAFEPKPALMAALIFLSWLGAYIHTTLELQLPVWRWEHSFPALVGLVLFLAWWRQRQQRRLWAMILLGWTAVTHLLIGATLSVLPVPLWPFYPEQSLGHYLSHVIYGVAQLPLIWVLLQALNKRNKASKAATKGQIVKKRLARPTLFKDLVDSVVRILAFACL